MIRVLSFALILMLGFGSSEGFADKHKAPESKRFKVQVLKLPPQLRRPLVAYLKEKGIEVTDAITLAASTDDCPSTCNDSAGGGFCYCKPDDEGNCPSGTEKGGTPDDPYCKAKMEKGVISGGGINDPLEVQMPW